MPDTDNADGIFCRVGQLPPVAGFQIHQRLWVVVSVLFFQVSYCRRIENSIRRESVACR